MKSLLWSITLIALTLPLCHAGQAASIFDGKTLEGWEGNAETFRADNGEIVGGFLSRKQDHNEFLATTKTYENFELNLKIKLLGTEGFVNSGIQFRSKRVPNHYEVSGFQADFGSGYDGALYDESRRNKVLTKPEKRVLEDAKVKAQDWNEYKIRVDGLHIQLWLNGVQTVDYTEADESLPRSGIIALQIHGGATAEVHFKDLMLEELPPSPKTPKPAKAPLDRITDVVNPLPPVPPFKDRKFELLKDETVVFIGPENMVIEQRNGWLETQLTAKFAAQHPKFRHMGWEGDTVYRQNRMENWGSWKENLEAVGATTVFCWFGQNEVLDKTKTPEDFKKAYVGMLDQLAEHTPRLVLIGPAGFEKPASKFVPDNTPLNGKVKEYSEIIRGLADARGYVFVDFSTEFFTDQVLPPFTRDGIHYTEAGSQVAAGVIAKQLNALKPDVSPALRTEVVEKNRIWFDCWRCMNWAFAYGDRTTQPFAKGNEKFPAFASDLTHYRPWVARADERVWAAAEGKALPDALPSEPTQSAPDAQSAEEQKKTLALYPGFSINLFADEKLGVIKPVQMHFDERGRMWVLCIPSYPQLQPGAKANDYLLMLEDTDGDGKADKATKIVEGLTMPMGFEFGDNGIYICEGTRLIHVPYKFGDEKAGPRRVVLSGFGTGDSHQLINSIRWCPDGCLWFSQGYHVWSYIETPHGVTELNRAGVWRFNPRTLKLDGFFNESTAGLNCWGVEYDRYGQVFHGSGANASLFYTTPGMINTLHPLENRHDFCVSKGKSMEPEFLESKHLPDELQGVLLKSTYFTGQVSMFKISDDGSGFKSEALPDLIKSQTTDFRPVETRVGPDGAIYCCDWLNTIIGHYQASYRDPRRDRSHGRIWKLTADGRPLTQRPAFEKLSAAELLELLKSPQKWEREQARRLLYGMESATVLAAADAWIQKLDLNKAEDERLLYEVSGVFCAHESPRVAMLDRLLSSKEYRLRCWGVRLISYWKSALPDPLKRLDVCMNDESARVRMETIIAASTFTDGDAINVVLKALDKPIDFYVQYALTQSIHALAPIWKPLLAQGKLNLGTRTSGLVYLIKTVGGQADLIAQMKIMADTLKDAEREELLSALGAVGGPADQQFVLGKEGITARIVDAVAESSRLKSIKPAGDLAPMLEKLFSNPNAEVRAATYRLATVWQQKNVAERAKAAAQDEKVSAAERAAALEAWARLAGKPASEEIAALTKASDRNVQVAALRALSVLDLPASAARAAELLTTIQTEEQAAEVLAPFVTKTDGALALAQALKGSKVSTANAQLALKWMAKTGLDQPELLKALNDLSGVVAQHREYAPELVIKFVQESKANGDAKRGGEIFHRADLACLSCHKVNAEGATIGPELSAVSRALTPELITEAVLWPKRQVKEGYLLTLVLTTDGRRLQGFLAGENKDELSLRDTATGKVQTLRKAEIKKRNDAGTLMPDGIVDRLNDAEVNDLLRYLMELGK